MAILGIYDGQNASAAVVSELSGCVVAAVEEERFSRVKNHDGRKPDLPGPVNSIGYCLSTCDEPISAVAIALEAPGDLSRKSINTFLTCVRNGDLDRLDCVEYYGQILDRCDLVMLPYATQTARVRKCVSALESGGLRPSEIDIEYIPHHVAHASGAFFAGPEDSSGVLTLDGKGDSLCGLIAVGKGAVLKVEQEIDYRHSIGHLYAAFTAACGYKSARDEGKLTAVAANGTPDESLLARLRLLYDEGV